MNVSEREIKDIDVALKMQQINASALSRNLEFDMSFKKVKQLMQTKKCYYTKVALTCNGKASDQLTFDRVDNTKGYIDSNVVACSKAFNEKKGCLLPSEIIEMYKGLTKKLSK